VPTALAVKMILGTASRAALISLAVMFLFVMVRGSAPRRMMGLIAVALLAFSAPFLINGNAIDRLSTLFGQSASGEIDREAKASQDERRYVLEQSLLATQTHPVFGVGLGQFPNYVGKLAKAEGKTGAALHWTETHNAFTQVSSECGIPALLFFLAGIFSSLYSADRIYRRARRENYPEIANAAFCFLLAMLGYATSIIFLAHAYHFYLPAMIGLSIALCETAEREFAAGRMQNMPGLPAAPAWNGAPVWRGAPAAGPRRFIR
jgi:O-antigen ligase